MGCCFLLQGIFPTQGSTHVSYVSRTGSRALYHQHHLGSPPQIHPVFPVPPGESLTQCSVGMGGEEKGKERNKLFSKYDRRWARTLCCAVLSRSAVSHSAIPWTVACQAPLCMGFSSQKYWSRLPFPSPGDLPDPGTEHVSPALQADSLPFRPPGSHLCPYKRYQRVHSLTVPSCTKEKPREQTSKGQSYVS